MIRIDPIEPSQVKSKMSDVVEGMQVRLSELAELTDWVAVKKVGVITVSFELHSFHDSVQQIERRPRHKGNPK